LANFDCHSKLVFVEALFLHEALKGFENNVDWNQWAYLVGVNLLFFLFEEFSDILLESLKGYFSVTNDEMALSHALIKHHGVRALTKGGNSEGRLSRL